MLKHRLPNGLEIFHMNGGETRFLYKEIFVDRLYTRHGITLPANACVFDVGANIGMSSLFFRQERPNVRLYLFEPAPAVFEALSATMKLNKVDAKLFNCALSRQAGTATFKYYPSNTVMSGLYSDEAADRKTTTTFLENSGIEREDAEEMAGDLFEAVSVTCQLRALSEVIATENIERIDLLKIDVEKAEKDVLDGIADADWPRIMQVVLEVHDVAGRLAIVRGELEARGFVVTVDQDPAFKGTELYDLFAVRGATAA